MDECGGKGNAGQLTPGGMVLAVEDHDDHNRRTWKIGAALDYYEIPDLIPRGGSDPTKSDIDLPHITYRCTTCLKDKNRHGGTDELSWIGPPPRTDIQKIQDAFHMIHYFYNCNGYHVAAWEDPITGVHFEFVALADLKLVNWMNGPCSGPKLWIVSNKRDMGMIRQTYRVRLISNETYKYLKTEGVEGV